LNEVLTSLPLTLVEFVIGCWHERHYKTAFQCDTSSAEDANTVWDIYSDALVEHRTLISKR